MKKQRFNSIRTRDDSEWRDRISKARAERRAKGLDEGGLDCDEIIAQPQLTVPTEIQIPKLDQQKKVFLDKHKVKHGLSLYRQLNPLWKSIRVHNGDFTLVGKYLVFWETTHYWNIILDNSVPGYSLFIHEVTELEWYFSRGLNPFSYKDQLKGYEKAHSLALIEEHRYLQKVVSDEEHCFSLRELIVSNPNTDAPEDDWELVEKQRKRKLSRADCVLNEKKLPLVKKWYHDIGFLRRELTW